jgi:hypothetical protein
MTTAGTGTKWRRLAVELTEHIAAGNQSAAWDLLCQQESDVWLELPHALLSMFNRAAHEFLSLTGLLTTAAQLMTIDNDPDARPEDHLAGSLILLHGWAANAAEPTDNDRDDWYNAGAELFNAAIEDAEADGMISGWDVIVAITRTWMDLLPVLRTGAGLCLLARCAADEPGSRQP